MDPLLIVGYLAIPVILTSVAFVAVRLNERSGRRLLADDAARSKQEAETGYARPFVA
jgi:hypothetical protein